MPSHVSRIESSGRTAEPQGTGMLSRVPFEHADRVLERKEGSTCRVLLHRVSSSNWSLKPLETRDVITDILQNIPFDEQP